MLTMTSHAERVVVLVDMDCFYCQVEEKLDPRLNGKPIAVVQYNAWKGGGIIAVNYPARDRGVTRHMRGNEAKEKCPEIELVRVPNIRGKADLSKYREAGKRVADVLQTFTPLLQRASVDEAYMDLTEAVNKKLTTMTEKILIDNLPNTHIVGSETKDFVHNIFNNELANENNLKLAIGGAIVEEIRATVYEKTGYRCSAGIAHNKILAKLACGLHKPNKQTILTQEGVEELYKNLPLKKIKSLGGKFGNSLSEELGITYMGELIKFSERELLQKYDEKTSSWLYNIARGIDKEPVETRLISKSIGCCKKFPGKSALTNVEDIKHWLSELATEISERLEQDIEENNRRAKQMTVSFAQSSNRKNSHSSRVQTLNSYDAKKIAIDAYEILRKNAQKSDGSFRLTFLGLNVGKFENCKNVHDISTFLKKCITNSTPENTAKKINDFNQEELLNINEIEEDAENCADINLNETLKDIENIKNINNNDDYSNTTVEFDFTEQLKNKQEFPYISEKSPIITNDSNLFNKSLKLGDTSKSFFKKYVKDLDNVKKIAIPTEQIILGDLPSCSYQQNTIIQYNSYDENTNSAINENSKKVCPECNQKVSDFDYISHIDHHMAERLMAEERQQFQTEFQAIKQNLTNTKTVKTNKTKSVKRKLATVGDNCSIVSFLTAKQFNKENEEMKVCSECNKKITLDSFQCHLDFHAAKKLHLELNPVNVGKMTENINKKKIAKNSNENVSIKNYFKTVEN